MMQILTHRFCPVPPSKACRCVTEQKQAAVLIMDRRARKTKIPGLSKHNCRQNCSKDHLRRGNTTSSLPNRMLLDKWQSEMDGCSRIWGGKWSMSVMIPDLMDGWVYRGGGGQSSAAKLMDLIEFKCIYLEMINDLGFRETQSQTPGPVPSCWWWLCYV